MSWTQGVQPREELPTAARRILDNLGKGEVEYITWFDEDRSTLFADYGERGSLKITISKETD